MLFLLTIRSIYVCFFLLRPVCLLFSVENDECSFWQVKHHEVTVNETTVSQECNVRPIFPTSAKSPNIGLWLVISWSIGTSESFLVERNGSLYHTDSEDIRRKKFIRNGFTKTMTYTSYSNFVIGHQGGYNFEYPCKFSDYVHLQEASTCVKLVQSAAPWDVARARCKYTYQGNLIRILHKVLNDKLSELLKKQGNSTYFWIGLQNRVFGSGDMRWRWLDDDKDGDLSPFFDWANVGKSQSGAIDENKVCTAKSRADGTWYKTDCFKYSYAYVCQKVSARDPGPPTVSVKYLSRLKHAYIGEEIQASCEAFTTIGAIVKFRIISMMTNSIVDIGDNYTRKDAYYTLEEDGKFMEMGDRCFPRSRATMRMKLTPDLFQTILVCCWFREDNFTSCSREITSSLLFPPQYPVLTVEGTSSLVLGEFLEATCSACVGSGGQLVWTLITLKGAMDWKSDFSYTYRILYEEFNKLFENMTETQVIYEGKNTTTISWTAKAISPCGPHIQTTFKRRVAKDLHGSVLICHSLDLENEFRNTGLVTARSTVFTVADHDIHTYTDITPLYIILGILLLILPMIGLAYYGVSCANKTEQKRRKKRLNFKTSPVNVNSATAVNQTNLQSNRDPSAWEKESEVSDEVTKNSDTRRQSKSSRSTIITWGGLGRDSRAWDTISRLKTYVIEEEHSV
ncbi:regenerating islet-derived protein 3-beta [Elysia marginata]|uniref:Regenerating islet-derived protein 3-beta n=1 Tax=Elysia marginata TaxID=1093978 RepID=A0AAV4FEU8_9GAST|nr:regenerating islet-derived protein 3-beta [Elysia marginata]